MQPLKCLRNTDSMGILFVGSPDSVREELAQNAQETVPHVLDLTDYGLCLQINTLKIPIQESMFEHLTTTGFIRVYAGDEKDYEMVLVYNITIDLDKLNQAIGAYNYKIGVFGKAS